MKKESMQSLGGKARAELLPPEQRKQIAKRAADARWSGAAPRATHEGELVVAGRKVACSVLETGKRLLTQQTFLTAFGRSARPKAGTGIRSTVDGLPAVISADNLKPFVSDELRQSTTPVVFRTVSGKKSIGYDAMLLPMVCEVYLKANDAGSVLTAHQKPIAAVCELLIRGLARVGIVALVDEATGYQEQRAKDELSKILEAYIVEELRPWIRTFPDEFFKQVYRLHGWEYKPGLGSRGPRYIGKFINKYIYEQLPPPVLPQLRELNPVTDKGYRRHKHFQFLTADTGNEHLDRQITAITMIMKVSDDKADYENNFAKAFAREYQPRLPLVIDVARSGANPS